MPDKKRFALLPVLALALVTMACNLTGLSSTPTPGLFATAVPTLAQASPLLASPVPASSNTSSPAQVIVPTNTLAPAQPQNNPGSASPTPPPTVVVVPVYTAAPVVVPPAAPTSSGPTTLKIYLIAMEDNGASGTKIGCNDSAIPVTIQVPHTQAVLRASLDYLLSLRSKDYGQSGLYNALYQSNLTVDSLALQNGTATIRLKGQLASGGVCDDPRIIAQLEQTALQFSTVQHVTIYVNGTRIQDLLSGK